MWTDLLLHNLTSPVVLAFFMGALARLARSDLKMPEQAHQALSVYLLLAIGMKGGVALSVQEPGVLATPVGLTVALGLFVPCVAYGLSRTLGRLSVDDSAALAAHYGSVSVVTFLAATGFVHMCQMTCEPFFPALVPVMEVPAILVALVLARCFHPLKASLGRILWDVCMGHSVLLLLGGVAIGWITGPAGYERVSPFFEQAFPGILVLYMLDMGMMAALRPDKFREVGIFLVLFAILMPVAGGFLGVWAAWQVGLSPGGATVLGAMTASASYIAAPAAIRVALPQAHPSCYLVSALGITFPFNIIVGIPLYYTWVRFLYALTDTLPA
jgi:hypothetical protein